MTTLTDFLLARIAEDKANNGCNGEGEYATCWRRSERVEREAEAKRRIVEYAGLIADDPTLPSTHLARHVLADLAAVYADHPDYPDYREEWKP